MRLRDMFMIQEGFENFKVDFDVVGERGDEPSVEQLQMVADQLGVGDEIHVSHGHGDTFFAESMDEDALKIFLMNVYKDDQDQPHSSWRELNDRYDFSELSRHEPVYVPKDDDEGYFDPSAGPSGLEEECGESKSSMDESHGERASKKGKRSRMKPFSTRGKDIDKPLGSPRSSGADDFGGKDPDDDMFFGSPDQGDVENDEDMYASDEDMASAIAGVEDPTSSQSIDTFGDEPEDAGFGSGIDRSELPSTFDAQGRQVNPDDDIDLGSKYDDEDSFTSQWSHYWDDRKRAKAQDDRFEPIRQRHGQSSGGLNPRRRPGRF